MNIPKKFIPHIVAIFSMIIATSIYFYPAFSGKTIEQDDIKLGVAKSKEIVDYREANGEEPLWTNSMFSGMPQFLMNIKHEGNLLSYLEKLSKLALPSQIGLISFLMIGFYMLGSVYKVDPWVNAIGAIAFGFSAFFIISYGAGHNAKIRAAGYLAPMLMGILLTYRGKYLLGLAFTSLFAGMGIMANHIQITYYGVIVAAVISIVELIRAIKEGRLNGYMKSVGVLLIAAMLAVAPNVSRLWTVYEYQQETIRGGGSGLKAESGENNEGLDKDYAMRWSYGITESFNLIVPNIMGGGSKQTYEGTEIHDQLFPQQKQYYLQQGASASVAEAQANASIASLFYWGEQGLVWGGYYLGASIFFLFVLGCILIKDKRRTWIIVSVVLAIFMALGKNMAWFNNLLFDYLPLYNKFRVPSMTFVIVFLLMPLMGVFAADYIVKNKEKESDFILKSLKKAFYIVGGLFLAIALFGPRFLSFDAPQEQLAQNPELLDMLKDDRASLARSSAFRSFIFAGLVFGALLLYVRNTLNKTRALLVMSALVIVDLWTVDTQFVNADDFVSDRQYEASFEATVADRSILQDQSYYRVFNLNNPFNDAMTSYYHHSIGGYHGAKLQRYLELFENVLANEAQTIGRTLQQTQGQGMDMAFQNTPVLNMLNGKYVIYNPGAPAISNSFANGAAWFIKDVQVKETAREVLEGLSQINTANTVLVHKQFGDVPTATTFSGEGTINLSQYDPKEMVYNTNANSDQFAVFSEVYYRGEEGDWQAYIDGEPVDHIRVNYVLRGMNIPAGAHEVKFVFKPESYYAGTTISLIGSILLLGVFGVIVFIRLRKPSSEENVADAEE
ncbi:MAG: hypothetical protein HWD92_04180 [Flavobacteriia bacterium]|nr:hypothetical protein [Flavobacteriia bacterium]